MTREELPLKCKVRSDVYHVHKLRGHHIGIKTKGNNFWLEADDAEVKTYDELAKLVGLELPQVMHLMQGNSLSGVGEDACTKLWMFFTIVMCVAYNHERGTLVDDLPEVEQTSMY